MTLGVGDRLGPYEILSPLGAGGMGEVYRARDPRLGREVAVKVLPASVSSDPDRLRRFEQEARAVGQLDHPGLLTVFDVGSHDGAPYLVSELLLGESLRARLGTGPLPRPQAIELGAQIASALAAAHARGVAHRDLKPENLFLTRDGRAKILDFGLARVAPEPAGASPQSGVATLSALTTPGTIVGTVGYMSPEQVRGEATDARSDIFSFGAVLYEMLTGRRAFSGASAVENLSAILKDEPPADLPPFLPEGDALWRVVKRCLEKRPELRFQSASDLAFALEMAQGGGTASAGATSGGGPAAGALPRWPWLAATGVIAVLALAAGSFLRRGGTPDPQTASPLAQATLSPLTVDPGDEIDPTFAPDNETIAYASDRSGDYEIYLQKASGGPAVNLTKNDGDDVQPSFSPDGQWIAFVSTRQSRHPLAYRAPRVPLLGGDVWVMPALGGPPRRIAEDGNFPTWSPDGTNVYFVTGKWFRSEVRRVPATGGEATLIPIRMPSGDSPPFRLGPSVSPNGQWLAFWTRGGGVYVVPSAGGEARRVAAGGFPSFSPDGTSILYANAEPGKGHSIWRAAFDPVSGVSSGPGAPLTYGTRENAGVIAPSRDGSKVALVSVDRAVNLEVVPFDADGSGPRGGAVALTRGGHRVGFFGPSPDGRSVVFQDERGTESHLWRVDGPGAEPFPLTLDPGFADSFPRWSPDGRRIAFSRQPLTPGVTAAASRGGLWLMAADGASPRSVTAEPVARSVWLADSASLVASLTANGGYFRLDLASGAATLTQDARMMSIFDVSQDGRWLACQSSVHDSVDILAARLDGGEEPRFVVTAPTEDYHPFFSPSGRWLYYQPEHKNIVRVPGPAQGWRVAPPEPVTHFPEHGLYLEEPQISRDGRTLVYARAQITGDIWLLSLRGR